MANTSLRSRLKRLFSTNVIVRRIGKKRLKVVDSNKLQSLGSMKNSRYIDRFSGMHTNKMESDITNSRTLLPGNMPRNVHSVDTHPKMAVAPFSYKDDRTVENRIDPGLLKAFKENPYTKPLNSVA